VSVAVAQGSGERFVDGCAFEFADPESGVCARCDLTVKPNAGQVSAFAALFDGEETIGQHSATAEQPAPGDWAGVEVNGIAAEVDERAGNVRVSGDEWGFEAEFSADGEPAYFDSTTEAAATIGAATEVTACRVRAKTSGRGGPRSVDCRGTMRRLIGTVDVPNLALVRALAVPFEDGGLLALSAARPARAEGHGEEGVTAFLGEADGAPARAEEALLSTQYDGNGEHVRAGLELSLPGDEEAPPLRGAGTRVCGAQFGAAVSTAFFRWELEGRTGIGRYDIVKTG
jgi:hypothetical protein